MLEIPILNTSFRHLGFSAPGKQPKNIKWLYDVPQSEWHKYPYVCFTDEFCTLEPPPNGIALILESQTIIHDIYFHVERSPHLSKFKHIFTHSSNLLKLPNAKWVPGGSIWIGGDYAGGSLGGKEKTKNISMISSNKMMCILHKWRATTALYFKNYMQDKVDVFGTVDGEWIQACKTLEEYRYSISIENNLDELYFTEKLLNCFATKTVPIYLGAQRIDKAFNHEGIVTIPSTAMLLEIVKDPPKIPQEAIEDNYQRCLKFEILEDYIYEKYLKEEI